MSRILLIDDDPDFSALLLHQLEQLGHEAICCNLAEDGLDLLVAQDRIDLVLLDNLMPGGMSGLEFLAAAAKHNLSVPVILMTSAHNDRTVIQAMNLGAFAYVIKPLDEDEIVDEFGPVIREALTITRRPQPVPLPKPNDRQGADDSLLVGRSKPMLDVLMRIGRLARVDETVLILGETGTGKDLVARAIHTNGARANKPFVVINCAALNENFLDDELFGHEAGAFTGAVKLRKGRFEHAQGGTLFLDEVGDMPLPLQVKLLRVLENREVVRIGSNDSIRVDVRVLAATHRDLHALVREDKFRQDLFFRLEGMTLHLPPLRQRSDDVELLASSFLNRLFDGNSAPVLDPYALAGLRGHAWPGNIRQLQKVLCRAAAGLPRGARLIMLEDLDFGELTPCSPDIAPEPVNPARARAGLRGAIAWAWQSETRDLWPLLQQQLECELLRFALEQPKVSEVQLARRLGIARNTLRARLKQHGLQEPPGGANVPPIPDKLARPAAAAAPPCPGEGPTILPTVNKALAEPVTGPPRNLSAGNRSPHSDESGDDARLTAFLAPPEADDELGRLGGFRILKILGHGGMGVVFQGEDPKLGRQVAIKAMLPDLAESKAAQQRFLREARAAAALEHDHIVPIFHVGEERGAPFIVMPLLQGEPLDKRLQREGKLRMAALLRIGRQTALGLEAAHKKGLTHRDIKPANIWLEAETERVKILDFGLARAAVDNAQLTQRGAIIGTPEDMSPEQARGEVVDQRSDLFSLGCVLYRMATGERPFKGDTTMGTLMALGLETPQAPHEVDPAVPEKLSDLVMHLLAKKPEDRPQSAQEVAAALAALAEEVTLEVPKPGRSKRPARPDNKA